MNETAPLQKQDIAPVYFKLNRIIDLLEKILEKLAVEPLIEVK